MTAVVVLLCLVGVILLLLLISLVRTLFIPSRRSEYVPAPDPARTTEYAEKLARMVRVETVSVPGENQREKFLGFHQELESLFPLVHEKLEKTEIDGNLLFFWKGKSAAKPLVLMSHQDVVPALFGAMACQYFRKDPRLAVVPMCAMTLLFVLVPSLTSSTSMMIMPAGALTITLAWLRWRKERKEAA